MRSKLLTTLTLLLAGIALFAQTPSATWKVKASAEGDGTYVLEFSAAIADGYHIYGAGVPFQGPEVEFAEGVTPEGPLENAVKGVEEDGHTVFYNKAAYRQKVRAEGNEIQGNITWIACREQECGMPEDYAFSVPAKPARNSAGGLWALILEAILWGFAMLLTPCVFPMVPMTVSFFLKGSSSAAAGRFKAFMYGLFIVLLYTVPISVIILLTRLIGGEAVTVDIFNWIATHWLPNLLFFVIFMVFAASFFGAFELQLPSSWTNKADAGADRKGLAGVFFMALTLVLVSFSCTGPIVGTVLIKSTSGEFWAPMVTMLAFSVAFALPFTLLALFPSLLTKLKSGSWLGGVKKVLGFIELALGLKFLSVADQTYHWGILDREVYLALWIVIFTLLGLYLLGLIHFKDDPERRPLNLVKLTLAIVDLAFVVYLIPGMWGAPLKALSGYLPPLETQDFVLERFQTGTAAMTGNETDDPGTDASLPPLRLPHGLYGYPSLDEALAASKETGKPVFVDITGHGCVNCREMEARVWSDPAVLPLLRDEFVIAVLYTDDKTKLPEEEWITTEGGTVLKDIGRVNSYKIKQRFGVNGQPNYTVLNADGEQIAPMRGYDLDAGAFATWLRTAIP